MEEIKADTNQELKKHVAVIHSHSKITLLQRKISNALLFHAYENLLTRDEHEIQISTLTKLINYDSHDHKKIKQGLMDLLATVVEWNIVDGDKLDKENVWNASSIIADASINGSTCTYSYSGKMRKLLHHPSVYGRLNMRVQAKFQSSYGLALYENCNRYQDIGQTPWFEIDKFRKLMGVEDSKYKIFRDFKTRVIDKSVEELNKHSSLFVEPKLKKQNRQVVAIQFIIKQRSIINTSLSKLNLESGSLSGILKTEYGLSHVQIAEVISRYEESYIKQKIGIIESSSSYQSGKIKNLGKYLLCALVEDYQPVTKPLGKKTQVNEKKSEINRIEYQRYLSVRVFELLSELTPESKADLVKIFEKWLTKSMFFRVYKEGGLENVLVKDEFIKFILGFENMISCKIKSLENWVITA